MFWPNSKTNYWGNQMKTKPDEIIGGTGWGNAYYVRYGSEWEMQIDGVTLFCTCGKKAMATSCWMVKMVDEVMNHYKIADQEKHPPVHSCEVCFDVLPDLIVETVEIDTTQEAREQAKLLDELFREAEGVIK